MNEQNSSVDNLVRPEDLMAELDLKKSTYYSVRSPTSSPTPQSESTGTSGRVSFKDSDAFNNVVKALAAGNSVLVLGEAGTGKGNFALALHEELSGEY